MSAEVNRLQLTNPVARLLQSEYLVLLLCAVYFVCLAPITPGFITGSNLTNILLTLLPLFVVALGQTIVMISGGIDLSVTSTMALCSVTGAAIMSGQNGWLAGNPFAVPVALGAMLLVGATVGLLNGLAISRLRMPPFIVTLTAMMFFSGLAIWLTKSRNIGDLPPGFNLFGGKLWLGLPLVMFLAALTHVYLS